MMIFNWLIYFFTPALYQALTSNVLFYTATTWRRTYFYSLYKRYEDQINSVWEGKYRSP